MRRPWARPSTPRKTTTPSTCLRKSSTTRISTRPENFPVTGWEGHSLVHFASRRSPDARGPRRVDAIKTAAEESLKATPLENAKIYLGGTAAVFKDISEGAKYDLLIAGISSLCLIFIIMLMITRSFVAALVIVGTVALSLGASFGLSVLLWQYVIRLELHWLVLAISVIILLAVGSDYNLLLVARLKQEIGAGLDTGIIRSMGGTGKVVTNAGLVFAFTMASMAVSECACSVRWGPPLA